MRSLISGIQLHIESISGSFTYYVTHNNEFQDPPPPSYKFSRENIFICLDFTKSQTHLKSKRPLDMSVDKRNKKLNMQLRQHGFETYSLCCS